MKSQTNLTALEVENQLLSTSRKQWKAVADNLLFALTFITPGIEQTLMHANAKELHKQLTENEKSTFSPSIHG